MKVAVVSPRYPLAWSLLRRQGDSLVYHPTEPTVLGRNIAAAVVVLDTNPYLKDSWLRQWPEASSLEPWETSLLLTLSELLESVIEFAVLIRGITPGGIEL